MDLGIKNKTALVTGAGRGIGAAVCRHLADEGARVLAVSRNEESLKSTIESLTHTDAHRSLVLDLETEGAVVELLRWLSSLEVDVDILVNNLGGTLDVIDPMAQQAEYWRVLYANLGCAIAINRELIPFMRARKWGRICHVSSISSLENQGPPAYCAAKAALNAYVRSMGRYVSSDNVIMTSVLPGAVFTSGGYWDEATQKRPESVQEYLNTRMAIGRFGRVEEIASVVSFSVSDHASFMVGTSILVDGGQGRVFQSFE